MSVDVAEEDTKPQKMQAPGHRIGKQRLRRIVSFVLGPDGQRLTETLACGHVLDPAPRNKPRKRVCPSCEERLGRVARRLVKPTPEQIDLVDAAQLTARTELARAKRKIERLERDLRALLRASPFHPVLGQTFAGRRVVELTTHMVTWVPDALYVQREGNTRGIKEKCRRADWPALCAKPFDRPANHG